MSKFLLHLELKLDPEALSEFRRIRRTSKVCILTNTEYHNPHNQTIEETGVEVLVNIPPKHLDAFYSMVSFHNFPARTAGRAALSARHPDWKKDCFKVGNAKSTRNDNRSAVSHHVYAYPVNPTMYPVLALELGLVCDPSDTAPRLVPTSIDTS